jgi:hypothetical protein
LNRHRQLAEDGLTGFELVILLTVFVCVTAILLVYMSGEDTDDLVRSFPGGLVAESVYISGDNIQLTGNVYGFPSLNRTHETAPILILHEDPGRLGVVRLVVSLFMGDTGAIDMDRVRVQWNCGAGNEVIPRTSSATLVCPNWTISGKYNMLPGRTADSDDWLEPGEQFEITLCPREGVPPYGAFILTFSPDGVAMPLKVSRTAPFRIQPVMNLG